MAAGSCSSLPPAMSQPAATLIPEPATVMAMPWRMPSWTFRRQMAQSELGVNS